MRPLILALETSTPWLSCALLERSGDALVVRATRAAGPAAQTSTLVPGVFEEVLREAGASLDDVGVLVAGLGPGLFTGTRVAVGTLKAVSYARSIPLIGGGSLDAMALAADAGRRRDRVGRPHPRARADLRPRADPRTRAGLPAPARGRSGPAAKGSGASQGLVVTDESGTSSAPSAGCGGSRVSHDDRARPPRHCQRAIARR